MKLSLENLGCLERGTMELRPLTLLCGGNNTGKTYAMYVLWSVLQRRFSARTNFLEREVVRLRESGVTTIDLRAVLSDGLDAFGRALGNATTQRLPALFRAPAEVFRASRVKIDLDPFQVLNVIETTAISQRLGGGTDKRPLIQADKQSGSTQLTLTQTTEELPSGIVSEFILDVISRIALSYFAADCSLLPAERGGLNIFAPDLDSKSAALLRHMKRDQLNVGELLKDVMVAQYAEPIEAYLQLLKQLPRLTRLPGDFHDSAVELQKRITRVRYKVDKDGGVTAKPYRSDVELGLHLTSSTAKNFYGLWGYLEGVAKTNSCLMIDEPELNLHPDNQRQIARLLARLVNRGIRVVISTHSDYIIREFNNLIMLSQEFQSRTPLAQKFGYDVDAESLSPDKVAAYHFTKGACDEIPIDPNSGIAVESIDRVTNALNASNTEIYFALAEEAPQVSP